MFNAFSRGPFFTALRLRFPVADDLEDLDDDRRREDDELEEDEWRSRSDLCFFFLCFFFFFLFFFSFLTTAVAPAGMEVAPLEEGAAGAGAFAFLFIMAERGMSSSDEDSM